MSYRQLIIAKKAHLSIKDSKILVKQDDFENLIPVEDVNIVVLDGSEITLSTNFLHICSKFQVCVMACGDNHMPSSITSSINQHYRPLQVIEYQINLTQSQKECLAEVLLKQKVLNQLFVVDTVRNDENATKLLSQYVNEIEGNDYINREGTAAKVFFNSLYGKDYVRFEEDVINHAQNYGYGVLRSCITRNINALGLCSYLGVNHHGKTNPFNLVYDLIEPFRPIVDYYIVENLYQFDDELKLQYRKELVNLLNAMVKVNDKTVTVQYAVELLAKSYLRSIEYGDLHLDLPNLMYVNFDKLNEPI